MRTRALAAALALIAATAAAEPHHRHATHASERIMCAVYPATPWCGPSPVQCAGTCALIDLAAITRLEGDVRRGFEFRDDADGTDVWDNHTADLNAGRKWKGDCEDLVITTLQHLYEAGVPLNHMWKVIVRDPRQNYYTAPGFHFVGVVEDAMGDKWVVADTYAAGPYPASKLERKVFMEGRLDDGQGWDIVEWGKPLPEHDF